MQSWKYTAIYAEPMRKSQSKRHFQYTEAENLDRIFIHGNQGQSMYFDVYESWLQSYFTYLFLKHG